MIRFIYKINFKIHNKKTLKIWIKQLFTEEKKYIGNINLIFCSDIYILKINKKYLNHNFYTDVITFNYVRNNIIDGDTFISIDIVKHNSKLYGEYIHKELYRVISHSLLHLIGYNDITNEQKIIMKQKEDFYINLLLNYIE
jgi:probable rRNA maturation factor